MRAIIFTYYLFLFALEGNAQQLATSSQYLINVSALNPAMVGHNENFEAFIGYQRNWLGINGAPEYKQLNLNGPITSNMGIGASISDDQAGVFRNLNIQLSYAYKLTLNEKSSLRFGTSLGMNDQHIQAGISNITDPSVLMANGNQKKHFNAGFGVNYQWKNFNAGIAIPFLFENKVTLGDSSNSAGYNQLRHYRLHLRHDFEINKQVSISPIVVVNSNAVSNNAEISVMINYKKRVWLALGYQISGIIGVHVGTLPLPNVCLQYSYGMGVGGVLSESSGNHELSIGMLIGKYKNTHTSIFQHEPGTKAKSYYKWLDK